MLFPYFFSLFQLTKRICICNDKCPYFCHSDSLTKYTNTNNFQNLILSTVKNYRNVEFSFYSENKSFLFEFNLDNFNKINKIIFKAFSNSQPVTVNIKNTNNSINENIIINPDEQLSLSSIISKIKQSNTKSLLDISSNSSKKMILKSSELLFVYDNLSIGEASGKYADSTYINEYSVPTENFVYESSGDKDKHPISLVFDKNGNTCWASSINTTETDKGYIIFEFNRLTYLEAIILLPAYATNRSITPQTRRYGGFPRILTIYVSVNDEPLKLQYIFRGEPKPTDLWHYVQYVFPEPFYCFKIKLEFTDVTFNNFFGNDYSASLCEIYLIQLDYENLNIAKSTEASKNYAYVDYINKYEISTNEFEYFSTGDQEDHPLSNAFDGINNTYWISSITDTNKTKSRLIINFTNYHYIDAIIFDPVYTTDESVTPNIRRYNGFPNIVNIYVSTLKNDEEFKLRYIFNGCPQSTDFWDHVQFVFPYSLFCNKLKIEFDGVTTNEFSNNEKKVSCSGLTFIKHESEDITTEKATGKYVNNTYVNEHKISIDSFTYRSSNSQKNHPISNAFDDNIKTYWISSVISNERNSVFITIDFNKTEYIEAILLTPTYLIDRNVIPNTRQYGGFPTVLKVYTATDDENLKLKYVFKGTPSSTDFWDCAQFVFSLPLFCDKLKLEFTEVAPNIFANNSRMASCTDIYFISPTLLSTSSPTNTPEPEPSQTPLPYPTQSPSPPEFRVVLVATDYEISSIHIAGTQFTKIMSNDNGGAIFILNSGITCINNMFLECISSKSGGGVYISNSCDFNNNIMIEDQIFNKCQSEYGGGIFIYSYSNKCILDINCCIFMNNKDTARDESETRFKGGSGIYITSRNAKINGCVFKNNRGSDSVIKIYNKNELFVGQNKDYLRIHDSLFEVEKGSKCSILYINEDKNSKIEVEDCIFSGDLSPGSKHIQVYYNEDLLNN